MYDSRPMDREGEAIELIVPEAIQATASSKGRTRMQTSAGALHEVPYRNRAFQALAGLAVAELLALAAVIPGAC